MAGGSSFRPTNLDGPLIEPQAYSGTHWKATLGRPVDQVGFLQDPSD